MICPACGNQIQDGTVFCPTCNTDLSMLYQAQPAYQAPAAGYQAPRRVSRVQAQQQLQPQQAAQVQVCQYCGRPLVPGQRCACRMGMSGMQQVMQQSGPMQPMQQSGPMRPMQQSGPIPMQGSGPIPGIRTGAQPRPAPQTEHRFNAPDMSGVGSFLKGLKYRCGISDPEMDKLDAYERGASIVPDSVIPSEGEVPVRQYEVCRMRDRFLGIETAKAIGRLQVTTRRVIFRAPGRGMNGRLLVQHEFDVNDVVGMEASRVNMFHLADLVVLLILTALLGAVVTLACTALHSVCGLILALLGLGGVVFFWLVKKLWLPKAVLLLAAAAGSLVTGMSMLGGRGGSVGGVLLLILAAIAMAHGIAAAALYTVRPELVMSIRTRTGDGVVSIRRGFHHRHGGTGFAEVLPVDDIYGVIREAMAVVEDVQTLGTQAAEKYYGRN